MDPTSEPEDAASAGSGSSRRRWLLLLGGLVLFAVIFHLVEGLVTPDEPTAAERTAGSSGPATPIRPEVTRIGDSGIHVEVEGGHRITVNLDDAEQADQMFACLEDAIAASPDLNEGEAAQPPESNTFFGRRARAEEVWRKVVPIVNGCISGATGLPADVPSPPPRVFD